MVFIIIVLIIALGLLWLDRASVIAELKALAGEAVADIEKVSAKAEAGVKSDIAIALGKLKAKL